MVCITMDAHGRDVVQKMTREGVTMVRSLSNVRFLFKNRDIHHLALCTPEVFPFPDLTKLVPIAD